MLVAVDTGHGRNTPGKRTPDDSMREHDFNGNVATKARGGEAEKIANIVQSLEYLNITPVDEVKETEPIKDEGGSLVMARVYQNGSTPEPVYADTDLKKKIGELNPREIAEYLSIDNDRPLVRYKVDGTNTYYRKDIKTVM